MTEMGLPAERIVMHPGNASLGYGIEYEYSIMERIRLAGAFGSHIDVKYAMVLGLIPDCDLGVVGSVGNAAGTGARIALLNRSKRIEIEAILRRVERIETAVEAGFQDDCRLS